MAVNFGYSVSDFALAIDLCYEVTMHLLNAPKKFKGLKAEVSYVAYYGRCLSIFCIGN